MATNRLPNRTSCQSGLMFTHDGNIETNAAPAIGPMVVLIPPRMTMTRMSTDTGQLNWPGETTPRKAKHQPAIPASAADSPNMPILTSGGAHPGGRGHRLGVADGQQHRSRAASGGC